MERPRDEDQSSRSIRYRLTPLQRVLPVLPAAVIVVVAQTVFWIDGGPFAPVLFSGLFMGAALPLERLVIGRFSGVTLTESAAIVHNWRRRVIPWVNIQGIRLESLLGSRTVVIYEAGGRRTRLRAPISGFLSWDRTFEGKFHSIGRWWLDHRGPDWAPAPLPGAQWGGPKTPGGFAPPSMTNSHPKTPDK